MLEHIYIHWGELYFNKSYLKRTEIKLYLV